MLARKLAKEAKKKQKERERLAEEEAKKAAAAQAALAKKKAQEAAAAKAKEKERKVLVEKEKTEEGIGTRETGEDLLLLLLKKWAEKVAEEKEDDFKHVWDKQSERGRQLEVMIAESEAASSRGGGAVSEYSTKLRSRKHAREKTVDELFQRLRRIEQLTRRIGNESGVHG